MEELIIAYLKSINVIQLLAIGGLFWIFYNRLLSKMETESKKMEAGFTGMKTDIKELREEIHSIDKRLCRIEGILHTQDCCAIKTSNDIRKAE